MSTLSRNPEVPNGCAYPDTNCSALGTSQHEEEQQDQTSLNQESSETCTAAKMFPRIQRSRSRQRHIKNRLHGKDQSAKSGSHDGMLKSNLGTLGSNGASASSSSSLPCDDVANNAEITPSGPGQGSGFCAIQGKPIDFLKCVDNLENQGAQSGGFPQQIVESKVVSSDRDTRVSNKSSVRDSLSVPLPDLSKPSVADSVCDRIPETHMLIEAKKLQFDAIESVCMNPTSEDIGQQQDCDAKSEHLDIAGGIPSSEDASTTNSQGPHSMGKLFLDQVRSGDLNPDGAPAEQHLKYTLECAHPVLTGVHSPTKKPSLTCPAEAPDSIHQPLLQKVTEHLPETNSLGRACPRVSRPLEIDTPNSDKTNCSQRPCSMVNPLLENDILQDIEDTKKLQSSICLVSSPYSGQLLTQLADSRFGAHASSGTSPSSLLGEDGHEHLSDLPINNSEPLQLPTQLADSRFEAHASSGTSPNSLIGEDGHGHLSNLPINDRNNQCSQGRSALSLELLPPLTSTSNDVRQSSLSSYRVQSNGKHSAVINLKSADNELSQKPYLSVRSSLELNGSIPDAETPLGHPPLDMENEMFKANSVSNLVSCYSVKLGDDAHISKAYGGSADNGKNESMVLKVLPSNSSERTREMHGTERNDVVLSEKCNESLQQGIMIAPCR